MIIVEIAGHLGTDPEVRFTPSGQKVTSFSVATNVRKQGKDETIWWRVTIWGDRFEKMLPFLKKGSGVIVIGEMSPPRIWKDKEGKDQVQMEVTAEIMKFSPFGKSDRPAQEGSGSAYGQGASAGYTQPATSSYAQQSPSSYIQSTPHSYAQPATPAYAPQPAPTYNQPAYNQLASTSYAPSAHSAPHQESSFSDTMFNTSPAGQSHRQMEEEDVPF